jgi:formate-dependent nitrite reductase membrane component NrfD
MKPYEWMVKYTPQTEWIEKRGLLLWLAFFFGGLGGGLYLVSLWFNSLLGMLIGWLIVLVLKGGTHLAYLGHPWRFWRALLRPQTSWISRGLIAIVLFACFGALQLIFSYWLPGSSAELIFKILAGIMALVVAIYTGFVLVYLTGVPFWNNGLLPIVFLACGITGGLGLTLAIALIGGGISIEALETWTRSMILITAILIVTYLWSATYAMTAGKVSVMELLKGRSAPWFWLGVVACGIVVPGGISAYSFVTGDVAHSLLFIGIACEIIGGLALRYCILKVGIYNPLIPVRS